MRRLVVTALLPLAMLAGGCDRSAPPAEELTEVTRVGDRVVSDEEFERYLMHQVGLAPEELDEAVRAQIYEEFLAEILFSRAAQRVGLVPPAEVLRSEMARLNAIDPELPEPIRRAEAERTLLARAYEERVLASEITVTAEELEEALGKSGRKRRTRDTVVFRQIVVEDKEDGDAAYRRITRQGEAFDLVAREISMSGDGGAPQQRRLGDLPEAAADRLKRLPEGQTSRPVEIDGLFYLFQLDALNYDADPGRDRERAEIRYRLFREKLDALRATRLAELAAQEDIRVPRTARLASEDQ